VAFSAWISPSALRLERETFHRYRRWYDRVDAVFEEDLPPEEPAPALRT